MKLCVLRATVRGCVGIGKAPFLACVLFLAAVHAETARADLDLGTWQQPTIMPTPRGQAVAVTDPATGLIYLAGGYSYSTDFPFDSMDVYDPVSNSWSSGPSMPTALRGAAGAYAAGRIFVFGGYDARGHQQIVQIYNIAMGAWTQAPFAPGMWESAATASNGKIYVLGGEEEALANTTEFDPETLTIAPKADMLHERLAHGSASFGSSVYAFGGYRSTPRGAHPYVDSYDPLADTWTDAPADMPTARFHFAEGVLAGHYLAAGGTTNYYNHESPYLDMLEVYDPVADSWSSGPPLPEGLREAAGAVSGGTFYVFGGFDSGVVSPEVYAIPEPATLALLALGGLALIRKPTA